jgi:DNA-binding phage protein
VITLTSFSAALGAELDALGYPAAPKRATTLAKDLGLGRTQAFRLLKGLSAPNLDSMAALRAMGVSTVG